MARTRGSSVSTSTRRNRSGDSVNTVAVPAATPRRAESGRDQPRSRPTTTPATRASPAPTVLIARTLGAWIQTVQRSRCTNSAPAAASDTSTASLSPRARSSRAAASKSTCVAKGRPANWHSSLTLGFSRAVPAAAAFASASPDVSTITSLPSRRTATISSGR